MLNDKKKYWAVQLERAFQNALIKEKDIAANRE